MFEDRWIRWVGQWNWSPDLTPVGFFLWESIKDLVYQKPLNTRQKLEAHKQAAFKELRKSTFEDVFLGFLPLSSQINVDSFR